MLTLGLDTCLDACSVALWRADGAMLGARFAPMRQGHAEHLCAMIDEVLRAAQVSPAQLTTIAITVGPGTFTGTRIGIAAARGFALATGARLAGATSLALLAATAREVLAVPAKARTLAVCLDARKGEVLLEILAPQQTTGLDRVRLLSPATAATAIRAEAPDALLIGSAAELVAAVGDSRLDTAHPDLLPDARNLAGLPLSPLERPTPLYARPPDARPGADAAIARAP